MRSVCREWNLMISDPNFIRHHLRNTISGIIIQEVASPGIVNYVEMRRGSLEICVFDWRLTDVVRTSCNGLVLVRTSCNGLVLAPESDCENLHVLSVINPLTKQRNVLPPYFGKFKSHVYFRLAFVDASMDYKVVHSYSDQIAVLTIGVDKVWRHIDIERLSFSRAALLSSPLVTGSYIHWIDETFVLTLNLETETIFQFPLPQLQPTFRRFLPMGSNLSIVSEFSEFFRDVWETNPKIGNWVKLLTFDLRSLSYKFPDLFPEHVNTIVPFCWLEARKVLLFSTSGTKRCCVAFNVQTGEIQSIMLGLESEEPHSFQAYVNSLAWWKEEFKRVGYVREMVNTYFAVPSCS